MSCLICMPHAVVLSLCDMVNISKHKQYNTLLWSMGAVGLGGGASASQTTHTAGQTVWSGQPRDGSRIVCFECLFFISESYIFNLLWSRCNDITCFTIRWNNSRTSAQKREWGRESEEWRDLLHSLSLLLPGHARQVERSINRSIDWQFWSKLIWVVVQAMSKIVVSSGLFIEPERIIGNWPNICTR